MSTLVNLMINITIYNAGKNHTHQLKTKTYNIKYRLMMECYMGNVLWYFVVDMRYIFSIILDANC